MQNKTSHPPINKRIVAWIDGVGGFLLCLDNEVMLGQSVASGNSSEGADVAILGNLSRRHASIRRDGESYVLQPIHSVSIDGTPLAGPTILRPGALVQLGENVQLRFRRPHALSATAVLTLESHHKTEPAVDGIVLMSESCILGPQSHSHIQCRGWNDPLVLIRRGEKLLCRANLPLEIDGVHSNTLETTVGNCRIESKEFALTLEEIGK